MLAIFICTVLLVFMVVVAARSKEGGENVIRHLYTYLVLFATLMMVIGGGISIFMATADLVSPTGYYQSYSDFKLMKENEKFYDKEQQRPVLSEEEIRGEYNLVVEDHRLRQKQDALNQMIKSLGFIVIPLPIFLYFNKMRKRKDEF